jgi:hypothetical protein
MPENNHLGCLAWPVAIPPAIARLSNREVERLLADLERSRLAEIDSYWALCHAEPDLAAGQATGAAPIVNDLWHLARNTFAAPCPSAIPSLARATARLCQVAAIGAALDDMCETLAADAADTFWEDGQVVAVKLLEGRQVLLLRYIGPLFNSGTVPEASLTAQADCYLVCHRGGDREEENYECLTVYLMGRVDANGHWQTLDVDLASRNELMRDLPGMETLVDRGRLSDAFFDARPLPGFPGNSDVLVKQINAHQAALRHAGAVTSKEQALAESRTGPLCARIEHLRQQVRRIEDELHETRAQILEAQAWALEETTGFARGDRVRHQSTGEEGALEIVHFGAAQFRLIGTNIYVTGDIRRGEWDKVDMSLRDPGSPPR